MTRGWRLLVAVGLAVLLLVLGLAVGLAAVAVHEWWPMLALVAAALAAVLLALPRAWWSRPPFAAGFVTVVALSSVPREEGDYLVGADATGYTLLGLSLVLVVLTLATLPRPIWRHERSEQTGP